MISIVIPLYNKEQQICKTLESVFAQSFQDYEVVIVNDGSTDKSVEIVEGMADKRIRLINQKNSGVSAARNKGIQESRGEYIAFLDADDEWKPDYLETIHGLIDKYPECDVFTARYEFKDEYGNVSQSKIKYLASSAETCLLSNYFHVASNSDAPLWTSVVVASRKALLSTGGFPEGVTSGEDLLAWAALACRYKIARSNRSLAIYYTPTTGPTGKVPADLTSTNDVVGMGLVDLSKQYQACGIEEYVSFWYKMRAVINLNRRNRIAAMKCAGKSIRYNPCNYKSWILMTLAIMPDCIIDKVMKR